MRRKDVVYTRFSTEMQRSESCEDQEREVRQGLALKGIDAADFEVIDDLAASGTKNNRLQFDQLRDRIQRGEINILAVDDQARFSRADNAFSFITDLAYAGGRFISTGEGIDTKQEGWELRVKVMELHNSTTIRELGRRVRRGQLGRVLDDGSAGDFPFGYESFYIDPNWAEASRRGPKPKKGVRIFDQKLGGCGRSSRGSPTRPSQSDGSLERAHKAVSRQGTQGNEARLAPSAGASYVVESQVYWRMALGSHAYHS